MSIAQHPPEVRERAIELVRSGWKQKHVAKRLQVHPHTIRAWVGEVRPRYEKTCDICSKTFVTQWYNQIRCGKECQEEARRRYDRAKNGGVPKPRPRPIVREELSCPSCDALVWEGDTFCISCGAPLKDGDGGLSNDEVERRFPGLLEEALQAYLQDPRYIEQMIQHGTRQVAKEQFGPKSPIQAALTEAWQPLTDEVNTRVGTGRKVAAPVSADHRVDA